jgi:hypothetical protein
MSQALPAPQPVLPELQKLTFNIVAWPAIAAGVFAVAWLLDKITGRDGYQLNDAAIAAAAVTTALAAAPFIRFIDVGWDSRCNEIRNRLHQKALIAYLVQFWEQRFRQKCPNLPKDPLHGAEPQLAAKIATSAADLFMEIYQEQYGRWAFLIPVILVLVTIAAETMIIVFGFVAYSPPNPPAADAYGYAWQAFGAMAGTYMFVAGDSVMAERRRALNISDVYWYALRLVLAVPVGIAVYKVGGDAMGAFVLGTLPIDQFRKVLNRYAGANVSDLEALNQTSDQLIQLEGVTADISAQLGMEGITSIEELLSTDPVSLAIRTGLGFKFVLRLGSQAVVRRHLGLGATALVPIGLADAEPVAKLVKKHTTGAGARRIVNPDDLAADEIVKNAVDFINKFANSGPAQKLNVPDAEMIPKSLAEAFQRIAEESYTKFLLATGDMDDGAAETRSQSHQSACSISKSAPAPPAKTWLSSSRHGV